MKAFWVLWGFDALVALVVLYFFFVGLGDGTVSSFNIGIWSVLLLVVGGVMLGSLGLRSTGRVRPAVGVLLILGLPGLVFVVFFGAVLIINPRWN